MEDSSCRWSSPPRWWRPRRRRPKQTSMPASPPRKFSPTPATRATAARGKSGQPARPSCGNIIPPARGKPRPWPLISPRWVVTRGRSNSGGPQPWARARRPRRGATKATAAARRSRANPRQVRPRRARSGLAVPPRAWKRAICRSLPRREAGPRLLRRKLSWRHRHGRTRSKTSRNSVAVAAELRPVPPACFQTGGNGKPVCATARKRGYRRAIGLRFPHALRKARQPRTLFFLRFGICRRRLVCGLTRAARRDHLWLEEGLRRRRGGGFLTFLAGNGDVLAASEPLGLVGVARDGDADRHFDLGMQRNRHLVQADRLDRRVERDLGAIDRKAFLRDQRR